MFEKKAEGKRKYHAEYRPRRFKLLSMIDDQNPTWADYNVSSFLIIESEDSHILEAESVTGTAS